MKKAVRPTYYTGHKAGVKNKLEAEYEIKLGLEKAQGKIIDYWFERYKLKIGEGCWYTPDFMVINQKGELEFHEVKGYWLDKARIKIKSVADQYPFIFRAFKKEKGLWVEEDFTVS